MAKCKFKIRLRAWECPLEALPGEEYCYWHREEEGKEPDDAKLRELKENRILEVFLRKAKLNEKDLQNAFLMKANLQRASLQSADLQGAFLFDAKLQRASLQSANLQGANLLYADLQGADLEDAKLEDANLIGVRVDSGTRLDWANLTYANLCLSYLDETKTLRNAKFEGEKEINEIVADFLKKGIKIWQFLMWGRLKRRIPKLWQSFLKRD